MEGGYPNNPAFEAALKQARERAAGFNVNRSTNRPRPQANAPDPPDSSSNDGGKTGNNNTKKKERMTKVGSAGQPRSPARAPTAATAGASAQHPGQREAAATERAAAAAAERNAAMYHHLTPGLHGRLGMGPGPGASALLFQHQLTDLQNRLAFEQRQHSALFAAASGRPPWGPGPYLGSSAEDRWRATQGLPPVGVAYLAGRGMHPGMPPLAPRGTIPSPHLPPIAPGSDGMPPELRAADFERSTARGPAPSGEGPDSKEGTSSPGGGMDLSLLAAAAEDTLRREERVKTNIAGDPDGKHGDPAAVHAEIHVAKGKAIKPPKKKRKGANEPKNPLGAFVFYQRKIMADVFEENPCITFGEAAAECGRRWRLLPNEAKEEFREMAANDKARYTRELATFKNKGEFVAGAIAASPDAKGKLAAPRRKKLDMDGIAKHKGDPKRPKTALLFFKAEEVPKVLEEFPNVTQKEAATEAAARWKMLTKNDKAKYEQLATHDKERYLREMKELEEAKQADMPTQRTRSGRVEAPPTVEKEPVMIQNSEEEKSDDKDINGWTPSAVQVPSKVAYENMKDPNPFYVEETAWRFHNPPIPPSPTKEDQPPEEADVKQFPYVSHEELRPLPPPPPLPAVFPNTPFCRWSYDEDTRVLHADFRRASGEVVVTLEDEKFLLEMFERDDITVVSEGLVSGLNKEKWTLDYISRVAGDEYYHRFRRFDKQAPGSATPSEKPKRKTSKNSSADANEGEKADAGTGANTDNEDASEEFKSIEHEEIDKMLSMKVKDFVTYLRRRGTALSTLKDALSEEERAALCTFSFLDHTGTEHQIDVTKSSLYMLDYDMVKLLPTLYEDFFKSFKLARGILPGGSHCMMNCVTSNGRPFMGPNMYVTPPGAFTHFHQDGHGTVDSGHLCLSGYNEVVMVRRLTERAKRHALRLLTGGYKLANGHSFEGLYDLPHADNLGEKPQWPNNEAIEKCNEMNYCVSRFILKEGQCVHINKGRLHAFRKVSNEPLPPNDCHAKLRADLMIPGTSEPVIGPGKPEILCISVAWDWMYRGVTPKGINREIISSLECAALNRKYGALSLAIPELSLIQMARTLAPKPDEKTAPPGAYKESLIGFGLDRLADNGFGINTEGYMPSPELICKGIFPALQYVVKQHIYAINVAESLKSKSFERNKRVSIAQRPNAWENPVTHPLDPYGNSDFFCKLCNKELSNVYLHCDGCELLLSKDFNICLECHQEKRYATSVQMHPLNNKRHSTINHIGNFTFDRASRCPCKNGPVCRHCNFCAGCSCRCHSWFTLYFRFFKKDDELKLLHRVKRLVGREELEAAAEAEKRLSMAIKGRYSEEGDSGPFGLHTMDVMVDSQFADAEDEDLAEPEDAAVDEDSETESGETPAAPPQPKRKSRRLMNDSADTDTPMESTDDAQDASDSEEASSSIDRTKKDAMQVAVQDLKVTIRYKSGEWDEEEVAVLRLALTDDPDNIDWTSIMEKLPERGSEQVRNYATKNFPELVEAFEKRVTDRKSAERDGEGETEEARQNESSKKCTSYQGGEMEAAKENEEPKDSHSEDEGPGEEEQEDDNEQNDPEDMDVDGQEHDGDNADPKKDAKDTEEVSTDGVVKVEETGSTDEESTQEEEQTEEEANENEKEVQPFEEKKSDCEDKLPPANQGRWQNDEKERLKIALQTCEDLEAVERYVGTRRMAAIRSFAPRTFPELYQELRDRTQSPEVKKERRRCSGRVVKADNRKAKNPDAAVSEPSPSPRRRSTRTSVSPVHSSSSLRRGSRRNAAASAAESEKEEEDSDGENKEHKETKTNAGDAGDTTEDESSGGEENESVDSPPEGTKPATLQRDRNNSVRQVSQSARGRRSTQDLSGGRRKRRSSAAAMPAADSGDSSESSEEDTSTRAITPRKRVKVED